MAGYTITITSNDEVGAQTTIRVETAAGSPRITELTVRAADGGAIFPEKLPALSLDQLIAALVPSGVPAGATAPDPTPSAPTTKASGTELPAGPASEPLPASEAVPADEPEPVAAPADEVETPAAPVESPARTARSTRAKKTRTAPAKKAPAHPRQTKADSAQTANGRRAYRRMPDSTELLAAYREVGGTTALARHYGVPRHTATGWLRRLRMQGLLES
ncbi:hypothetical protein ACNTMW_30110 [Planosporangium sp. 12N6]|uniref:hypothetical protein n=1 Tax=Planosporangium spinosum TaxID=3402278 RepID=UPI003CFA53DA